VILSRTSLAGEEATHRQADDSSTVRHHDLSRSKFAFSDGFESGDARERRQLLAR
jgi:hypothetical protein